MHASGSRTVNVLRSRTVWCMSRSSFPSRICYPSPWACIILCLLSWWSGQLLPSWARDSHIRLLGILRIHFAVHSPLLWRIKCSPSYCNTSRFFASIRIKAISPVLLVGPSRWLRYHCLTLWWYEWTLILVILSRPRWVLQICTWGKKGLLYARLCHCTVGL